jgi:hypothetical protein
MHWGHKKLYSQSSENLKVQDYMEDLGGDETMILKRILQVDWIGFW